MPLKPAHKLESQAASSATICVPISPGELLDKISILEIKLERIFDPAKLENVRRELATLADARQGLPMLLELNALTSALKAVNKSLWDIEDSIRECEWRKEFGPAFIELARSVYRNNDRRAAIKRQINELLGSVLVEEKAYASY